MKNRTLTVVLAALVVSVCLVDGCAAAGPDRISVIPKPMEIRQTGGHFKLKDKTAIYFQCGSAKAKQSQSTLPKLSDPPPALVWSYWSSQKPNRPLIRSC